MEDEKRKKDDSPDREASEREIIGRWTHAVNKRLTIDRALTNKRALPEKLVKSTWSGCLDNEEELPTDWYRLKEVLVGFFSLCPPRRNG